MMMLWNSIWLYIFLVLLEILMTSGQSIKPVDICKNNIVAVPLGGFGKMQHVQSELPMARCSLILAGLNNDGYLAIVGPFHDPLKYPKLCRGSSVFLVINGVQYCYTPSLEYLILQRIEGQAWFNVISTTPNFTIEYYSNVGSCGSTMTMPESAQPNQFSGIICSSYESGKIVALDQCNATIENLPNKEVTLRFSLLISDLASHHISIDNRDNEMDRTTGQLVVTSTSRQISMRAPGYSGYFIIKFTILHCEDFPFNATGTSSPPVTPWLVGTEANYSCDEEHYMVKGTPSTLKCVVVGYEGKWSDHMPIKCIRLSQCGLPIEVEHATYQIPGDNRTITYHCNKGFLSNESANATSICDPPDYGNESWMWSDVELNCEKDVKVKRNNNDEYLFAKIFSTLLASTILLCVLLCGVAYYISNQKKNVVSTNESSFGKLLQSNNKKRRQLSSLTDVKEKSEGRNISSRKRSASISSHSVSISSHSKTNEC